MTAAVITLLAIGIVTAHVFAAAVIVAAPAAATADVTVFYLPPPTPLSDARKSSFLYWYDVRLWLEGGMSVAQRLYELLFCLWSFPPTPPSPYPLH